MTSVFGFLKNIRAGGMSNDVEDVVQPVVMGGDNHDFDMIIKRGVTTMVAELIKPWLESCATKYSEAEFHQRMANGFDFVQDWEQNHQQRYHTIIKRARRMRRFFIFDVEWILKQTEVRFASNGWTLYPAEKQKLRETLQHLKDEIDA